MAIRLALLAALAGEHLLLVGPPGTAKSVLARRLHLAFSNASYFERLLTRWRAPPTIIAKVTVAREAGTRFHGVQVGAVGHTGLHTLCEHVHELRSWATLGGG